MQDIFIPDSFVLKGRAFSGFHALPKHEAQRLYTGLIKYGNSCGCDEGAIGVLLSICLYLLVGFGMPVLLTEPVIVTWQLGVVAAVAGGAVGKCVGLWWAHLRFECLQRDLDTLANSQAQTKDCTAETNQTGGFSHG